jgi:hypothetical protein
MGQGGSFSEIPFIVIAPPESSIIWWPFVRYEMMVKKRVHALICDFNADNK